MEIKRLDALPPVSVYPPLSEYRPAILKEAIYLDTETSHIGEEVGWIYQWAFVFADGVAIGRKPSELMLWLRRIEAAYNLREDLKCIIFVHNLSYDIQYLKDWAYNEWGEFRILATSPHKFITFEAGPYIWRCTFRLSNRSLAKWGKDLGIKETKKSGMIDYDVIRYQDTPLARRDWVYQIYDVLALRSCVRAQNIMEGDTIATMPLTSTAYVRRDSRHIYKRKQAENRKLFLECRMDVILYKALHICFAGGLTHGNRMLADQVVCDEEGNPLRVGHGDFMSHYPTQERACVGDEMRGYPVGKFALLYQDRGDNDLDMALLWEKAKTHCLIIQICIGDMEIKPGITMPYAQAYKFQQGRLPDYGRAIEDNGRILKMTGHAVVTLTELDLKWIHAQYNYSYKILRVWSAPRGKLPEWLCKTVDKFFFAKTDTKAKIADAKAAGDKAREAELKKTYDGMDKPRLNGIYGMTATNPVRQDIILDEFGEWSAEPLTDAKIEEKLETYYGSKNSFMTYAFGVYCTALARDEIMTVISKVIGYKSFIYADTDSAFFIYSKDIMDRIAAFNKERQAHSKAVGAYIVHRGKRVYYDRFDIEEDDIEQFRFLHAKAYAYIHKGELHCTIAGVTSMGRKGKKLITREQELGDINNLTEGTIFAACGGTRCVYNEGHPREENINGHITEVSSSAIILPTEKTLHGLISKNEYRIDWEMVTDEEVENRVL